MAPNKQTKKKTVGIGFIHAEEKTHDFRLLLKSDSRNTKGTQDPSLGWLVPQVIGGWAQLPVDVSVVNNHGDCFRPLIGFVGPLPNGRFMAYKWGLLTSY